MTQIRVVRAGDRVVFEADATSGLIREEAFSGDGPTQPRPCSARCRPAQQAMVAVSTGPDTQETTPHTRCGRRRKGPTPFSTSGESPTKLVEWQSSSRVTWACQGLAGSAGIRSTQRRRNRHPYPPGATPRTPRIATSAKHLKLAERVATARRKPRKRGCFRALNPDIAGLQNLCDLTDTRTDAFAPGHRPLRLHRNPASDRCLAAEMAHQKA
jgi:hypothetical protein